MTADLLRALVGPLVACAGVFLGALALARFVVPASRRELRPIVVVVPTVLALLVTVPPAVGWSTGLLVPAVVTAVVAALTLWLAPPLGRVLARVLAPAVPKAWRPLLDQSVAVAIVVLVSLVGLELWNVDSGAVLGAAGLFTVALGFAAQTVASNFLSGVFVMIEASIEVGDIVEIDGISGEVLAIEALAVQLRTFDNRRVRIPNERLMKGPLVNLSRHPIRRIDYALEIDQEANLSAAREALLSLAQATPGVLQEPSATVMLRGFERGLAQIQFSVWATREGWIDVRTTVAEGLVGALKEAGTPLGVPRMGVQTDKRAAQAAAGEPP